MKSVIKNSHEMNAGNFSAKIHRRLSYTLRFTFMVSYIYIWEKYIYILLFQRNEYIKWLELQSSSATAKATITNLTRMQQKEYGFS